MKRTKTEVQWEGMLPQVIICALKKNTDFEIKNKKTTAAYIKMEMYHRRTFCRLSVGPPLLSLPSLNPEATQIINEDWASLRTTAID